MLENISLFDGVNPAKLESVAGYFGSPKSYDAHAELMAPGENENAVFFLLEGKVRLSLVSSEGNLISYREIAPYDYFGWLSALDNRERLTSAIALEPVKVMIVKADQFRKILFSDFRISENFMRRMGGTLRRYTERIQELTVLPARQRIMRELARRFGDKNGPIDLGSHEDFATWTGTTRETVTRTFAALEDEGFIRKENTGYRMLRALDAADMWLSG